MQNIVLFIIFGIVGVLCIYNLTVGRKIREKATQHNKDVFGALMDRATEHFGSQRCEALQFVKYMTDDNNGYLLSYKRNEKKIQEELDKHGFFVIVTSKEMTAGEALEIYRKRDSVEKIFRMLKTGLEYDTFRVHSQLSLESKTYVLFLASIVRNYLYQGLKEAAVKGKNRKSYTVPAAISELEKIIAVKNSKDKYIRRYGLTAKQKKILSQFNLNDSDVSRAVNQLNL